MNLQQKFNDNQIYFKFDYGNEDQKIDLYINRDNDFNRSHTGVKAYHFMDGLSCPTDGLVGEYADIIAKNITLKNGDDTITISADGDGFSLDTTKYYTKEEVDEELNGKADKSTTLAGYGIENAYTKTEVNNLLTNKANTSSVYTKTQTNNLLDAKANANDVYTKQEVNTLIQNSSVEYELITNAEIDAIVAGT